MEHTSRPAVDLTTGAATLQAYQDYVELESATQRATDRAGTLGTPPVENGEKAVADNLLLRVPPTSATGE